VNDTATSVDLDSVPSTQVDASNALRGVYRGRLFRKYLLLILTLVSIALLASGGISLYFTYEETKSALASLQHEKALAAASRIEQYIRQIERQITSAALPQLDASDVEARRIEFLKALRQAPEITDIAEVDAAGREQIAVSRLGMDSLRSNKDRSQDPAFLNARRGQAFFSPVYFRKETEPYMTIGVRSAGDKGPVTIADVNLKFVWDVVSRIKIGESGKAYVVDANGFLVADPDIGLVLRKTNLSELPHVQAAKQRGTGNDELAMLSRDIGGTAVLASLAPIESLNWNVFVEQPVAEVYRKLNASISRTGVLLLAGLFLSALGAWALARGMVRPIRTLEEGAQRIGAGDLDQAIDIKTGDELESLADGFNRMSSRLKESYAGLERKVEERTRALQNSLDQQTAISEILRVISSSPTDVQPVLDAVAERAAQLCGAPFARVLLIDGALLRLASEFSLEGESLAPPRQPIPFKRTVVIGRAALDRATLHYADILPLLDTEFPDSRPTITSIGARGVLAVPLMREGGAYGGIFLFRREPKLFSPDQVALVETFARQAAIAIDNVRLFNETKRALEQQTAISEILRVISSSPTDVQPVLDAVAERAAHLCDAPTARVLVIDGELLRPKAQYTTSGEALPSVTPTLLKRTTMNGRAALDRETVHITDVVPLLDNEFPDGKENALRQGIRSVLAVPLVREGGAYGTILLWRREVKPFTTDQVALVETFARQAAIAIDNVRLFNETKEALEQQTAISEILRVISSSPTDVQPVFDIISERALNLCDAEVSFVSRLDGDMIQLGAMRGIAQEALTAVRNAFPQRLSSNTVTARTIRERRVVEVEDVLSEPDYEARAAALAGSWRGSLGVPMLHESEVIGAIFVAHRDPGRFSDSQIALLKTFADQAAIAIQNVRLFNETKEALEQQTAVAEILRVISGSPTNVQPVLDAIAERAARLCDASSASMYLTDGNQLRHLASQGPVAESVTRLESFPINRESISGRAILNRTTMHIADMLAVADEYPLSAEIARRYGHRTVLVMPLFREGQPFGTIVLRRLDVRPFGERELALLRTFGDQAAIALENTRLFNETKEALEQQRASGEVLSAISSSIADTKPVFEKIVASCERLFAGKYVGINLVDDDGTLRIGAFHGPNREAFEQLLAEKVRADETTATGQAIRTRSVVHVPDTSAPDVPEGSRRGGQITGMKAAIYAPMLWEGKGLGVIWVARDFAGPFSEKEIALLKTFADQAVIAIQNARLFNETKEALEQQRASGDVLAAISNSIADTSPVFETILASCERLFVGKIAVIDLIGDDGLVHLGGYHGPHRNEVERVYPHTVDMTSATGTAIATRAVVHYANWDDAPEGARACVQVFGIQAAIGAPMMWEGKGIGAIWVARDYTGAFSEKEIALLKTFADQAVIAIQNARLFNETKEALDQQRASAEVLATISSSIADTAPVFDKILESCERLFRRNDGGHQPGRRRTTSFISAPITARSERNGKKIFPITVSEESGSGTANRSSRRSPHSRCGRRWHSA
jgi:GAF domain-containing protein/HAMP domain-containing protein